MHWLTLDPRRMEKLYQSLKNVFVKWVPGWKWMVKPSTVVFHGNIRMIQPTQTFGILFIDKCISYLFSCMIGIHNPKTCNQSTQLFSPGLKAQHKSLLVLQLLRLVQLWHFLAAVMVHWNGNLVVPVVESSSMSRVWRSIHWPVTGHGSSSYKMSLRNQQVTFEAKIVDHNGLSLFRICHRFYIFIFFVFRFWIHFMQARHLIRKTMDEANKEKIVCLWITDVGYQNKNIRFTVYIADGFYPFIACFVVLVQTWRRRVLRVNLLIPHTPMISSKISSLLWSWMDYTKASIAWHYTTISYVIEVVFDLHKGYISCDTLTLYWHITGEKKNINVW